jgi:hypothetical protein
MHLTWSIEWPNSTAFVLDAERKECGLKVLVSIPALVITLVIQFATVVGFTDTEGLSEESRYVKNNVWSGGRRCRTPFVFSSNLDSVCTGHISRLLCSLRRIDLTWPSLGVLACTNAQFRIFFLQDNIPMLKATDVRPWMPHCCYTQYYNGF